MTDTTTPLYKLMHAGVAGLTASRENNDTCAHSRGTPPHPVPAILPIPQPGPGMSCASHGVADPRHCDGLGCRFLTY